MTLQKIPSHPEPKPRLEQYATPANIAADVLFLAHSFGDIENKVVFDLGCGTGTFAIGAKLLGAREVMGIDIDSKAIEIATETVENFGLEVDFRISEIKDFNMKCDTVLQNPPFGAQKKHADRPFIKVALDIAKVVYSLHLEKTREFIEEEAKKQKARVTHTKSYEFEIRHTFKFHSKEKKFFDVMMFRMEKLRE
ncbi:MAG: methyltransferase [Thermoplasmata archaeon]|nr:MAG: methyltransferase [Thermoplasmata archaeon]